MYSTETLGKSIFVWSLKSMHVPVPKLLFLRQRRWGRGASKESPLKPCLPCLSLDGIRSWGPTLPTFIPSLGWLLRVRGMKWWDSSTRVRLPPQQVFPQGSGGCSYEWGRSKCCRLVDTSHNCNFQRADCQPLLLNKALGFVNTTWLEKWSGQRFETEL